MARETLWGVSQHCYSSWGAARARGSSRVVARTSLWLPGVSSAFAASLGGSRPPSSVTIDSGLLLRTVAGGRVQVQQFLERSALGVSGTRDESGCGRCPDFHSSVAASNTM